MPQLKKYVHDLKDFQSYAAGADVDKKLVLSYKEHLSSVYAPSSTNSKLAALNSFFREMEWNDCIVKTLRVQRQNFRDCDKVLSRGEYFMLLETARKKAGKDCITFRKPSAPPASGSAS